MVDGILLINQNFNTPKRINSMLWAFNRILWSFNISIFILTFWNQIAFFMVFLWRQNHQHVQDQGSGANLLHGSQNHAVEVVIVVLLQKMRAQILHLWQLFAKFLLEYLVPLQQLFKKKLQSHQLGSLP